MGELLRPPSHRGPLIAAGAVLLTVGVALVQVRLGGDLGSGLHLAVAAALAALLLWLGLQGPREGGRPAGHQSVLLACGLLAAWSALLWLSDVLGADFDEFPAGAFVWTSLVQAGLGVLAATRGESAIGLFAAAVAIGVAVLSAAEWLGDPSVATIRVLLLGMAVFYVVVSLALRAPRPRHSEVLVDAAGLAVLGIALTAGGGPLSFFFGFGSGDVLPLLPAFWEIVVLASGLGLIAYAAADHVPGPAWIGVANLAAFVGVTTVFADETLEWWPALLLAAGLAMLAAGLRPRRPLPPEPDAYASDDVPLYVRVRE